MVLHGDVVVVEPDFWIFDVARSNEATRRAADRRWNKDDRQALWGWRGRFGKAGGGGVPQGGAGGGGEMHEEEKT